MKAYVINLDRDTKKWQQMQAKAPLPVQRFAAINGSTHPNRPFHMNAMMYGCLLSHRALWSIIAAEPADCLILEDDCVFKDHFVEKLTEHLHSAPSDYDILILGYTASDVSNDVLLAAAANPFMWRRTMRKVNDDWWVPGIFIGRLTPAGARKLLQNTDMYHTDCVFQ
jgi:GR25 family glycosyltransferase involved in LPS biosynthesis